MSVSMGSLTEPDDCEPRWIPIEEREHILVWADGRRESRGKQRWRGNRLNLYGWDSEAVFRRRIDPDGTIVEWIEVVS